MASVAGALESAEDGMLGKLRLQIGDIESGGAQDSTGDGDGMSSC